METTKITSVSREDLTYYRSLAKACSQQIGHLPLQAIQQKADRGSVFYASVNGDPVGFFVAELTRTDPRICAIYQAAVQMDARRRRHALEALTQIEALMGDRGAHLVRLWCREGLEAEAFWDAAGYEISWTKRGPTTRGLAVHCWSNSLIPNDLDPAATRAASPNNPRHPQPGTQFRLWSEEPTPSVATRINAAARG